MNAPRPAPQALVVIDVQEGFDQTDHWGPTANPQCEHNIARLIDCWRDTRRGPIVAVRHDSAAGSPLAPGTRGNELKAFVAESGYDVLVTKQVNSAFLGTPDLRAWLDDRAISDIVLCGIQTNMCVETTARMGGNLGFRVSVPLDATRTFDLVTTLPDGSEIQMTATDLMRATAANLRGGRFAVVVATADLLRSSCAESQELARHRSRDENHADPDGSRLA